MQPIDNIQSQHPAHPPPYDSASPRVQRRTLGQAFGQADASRQHTSSTTTQARSSSNIAVFIYERRMCAVRQPLSYQDALMLVRSQVVTFDQTKSEVRFLARVPMLNESQDVEVTPSAWEILAPGISKFRIVIADKQVRQSDSAIARRDSQGGSRTLTIWLFLTIWYDGSDRGQVCARPSDSFRAIKAGIHQEFPDLPIDDQVLVIWHSGKTISPHDDDTFSQYRVKDGQRISVYTKDDFRSSRTTNQTLDWW